MSPGESADSACARFTGSILFKAVTKRPFALADGVLVISCDEQAELTAFSPESRLRRPEPRPDPTMAIGTSASMVRDVGPPKCAHIT
jgi:hypothetical protein